MSDSPMPPGSSRGLSKGTSEGRSGPRSAGAVATPSQPGPASVGRAGSLVAAEPARIRLAEAQVGRTVKGWRLERLLGVGTVTAAYEATRPPSATRDVSQPSRGTFRLALATEATDERARAYFQRAAFAANRFHHPRIVPVLEGGNDDGGAPWVVRAATDATPLARVVGQGPQGTMSEKQVLKMAEQVLDALEMAHSHGVVHGAIHPGNVLVTPRGSIRLCDFATPPGTSPRPPEDEDDPLALLRVSPFSSPERSALGAKAPNEASDTYELAACMYFAATGRLPEEARGADGAPNVRTSTPALGEGFAAILDHALRADPTRRYTSAYAMLGDVRRVLGGRPPKLGEALKPIPSGSFSGMAPSSMRRLSNPPSRVSALPTSALHRAEGAKRKAEWKGNVLLILAIAVLVGVATFVMVRERVEEQRTPRAAPADAR